MEDLEVQGDNQLPKMLTVMDIKNHLSVSKTVAYKIVQLKDFPKIKIGHKYIIPEDEYLKWITKHVKTDILL